MYEDSQKELQYACENQAAQLVEGNAELMETNSENVVKLKNIVDMFQN